MSPACSKNATLCARALAATVAGLAALVLFGWVSHFPTLTSFIPGAAVTRPESALGYLCATLAVWGLSASEGHKLARTLGMIAAFAACAIGGEALVVHVFDLHTLHTELLPASPNHVHVISTSTALGITLTGLGLLLSTRRSPVALRAFDIAIVVVLVLGALGVVAALYDWYEATLPRGLRITALPSGMALVGLGVSSALLHPERGLVHATLESGPSGALLRRLLPAAILFPMLLGFVKRVADYRDWLSEFGTAPFVVLEIATAVWLVSRSARWVGRFDAQRAETQRALDEEMHAHAALLTERELQYRLLAETAPQIVWTAGPDGHVDYLSPTWARFTGEPVRLGEGWRWERYLHPDEREAVSRRWSESTQRGEPYEMEYRVRRHDGRYRWFLSRAIPLRDPHGRILRWYGADTDVHELHETREALRVNEERFRVALHDRDFIVWSQDLQLRYSWVNNPPADYQPERSLGRTDKEVLEFPHEAAELEVLKQRVLNTKQPYSGQVALHVDRELRYYEMRVAPSFDGEGRVTGVAGAAYDITKRKRSEEALLEAQKYQTIGQLAAGVAHDFNNLLTAILGNTTLARSSLPEDDHERVKMLLDRVVESGESAAALTRQLLAYAGKARYQVEPTDLHALEEFLVNLTRTNVPSSIRIDFAVPRELPLVRADAHQLRQLASSLITNAVEALEQRGGGRIAVEMRALKLDPAAARALDVRDVPDSGVAEYVQLEVRDDGPGMSPETLRRAFEPFFTTKFLGRGLGLSAAQGVARAHGGGLVAQSELARGTRLLVTLPALTTSRAEQHARRSAEPRSALSAVHSERAAAVGARGERIAHHDGHSERVAHQNSLSERVAHQNSLSERVAHQNSHSERIARQDSRSEHAAHQNSHSERIAHQDSRSEHAAHQDAHSERIAHQNSRSEHVAHQDGYSERIAHQNSLSERIAHQDGHSERVPFGRADEPAPTQGSGTHVLFVDDEPQLREMGKAILKQAGYSVELAENGVQAISVVRAKRAKGEPVEAIVLDMTMPVMGGVEAAHRLRSEHVDVPIVASSGYSEDETLERFGDTAPVFLHKPYRAKELLTTTALARAKK